MMMAATAATNLIPVIEMLPNNQIQSLRFDLTISGPNKGKKEESNLFI